MFNNNTLPLHPLQSIEWGKFREKTGLKIVRIAEGFQMSLHPLPYLPFKIGYLPKCGIPTREILEQITQAGKKENCIFVKLEPNIIYNSEFRFQNSNSEFRIEKSKHPLFTRYSFQLDLTKSEDELFNSFKPKTRYNIRIAQKHGVKVVEDNSPVAFESYLKLAKETWARQKFYAHEENYHRLMWETLHPAGIAHLLIAHLPTKQSVSQLPISNYQLPLTAWIVFLYKDVLYYPYGASSSEHKELMASNLMMWEAIKWGKAHGAKLFDMWGSLGPDPDISDPWYGFHRFKEGYGAKLVEFAGSYDLVINPLAYKAYNLVYLIRQKLLQI